MKVNPKTVKFVLDLVAAVAVAAGGVVAKYYYSDNLFFIKKDEKEFLFYSVSDPYAYRIENGHIKYSGLYFRNFGKNTKPFLIHENELPDEIHLGKIDFGDGETIKLNPQKEKKIFENGKYIGPRIFEENTIDF